ncbi:type II toxin-antitoxin system HicA family toxin [Terriglobus sp. RCC_193]|uniref:type II toxin-antitoxin system HicA family toxin n=1 Tax=Terriglobus sp. RCC_193 TaxID=3239218 RepID=UPI003525CDB5
MGTLANISTDEAIKVFKKLGWDFDRKRGSHIVLVKSGAKNLVLPERKEMRPGTLRGLIRDAEITVDEFLALH